MSIDIRDLHKSYGETEVLKGVTLSVDKGELLAMLGPSGCGKTTLLRIIAGLETADSGEVYCEGQQVLEENPEARRMGFVFQHYALFRHMTVFENIAFGLRARPRAKRPAENEIRKRVDVLLDIIQLNWIAKRYPEQLSGGQRQRVALARVLAVEPRVLLLDEPFGALDAKVRVELRHWLRERHADLGVTTIFVTHDQEEALDVADRVVVIDAGRVEQVGTPDDVYNRPRTPFVCKFMGTVNLLQPDIGEDGPLYARPHEIDVTRDPGPGRQPVAVRAVRKAGPLVRLAVELNGSAVEIAVTHADMARLEAAPGCVLYAMPCVKRVYANPPGGKDEGK